MNHLNLEDSFMDVIQTQLNFLYALFEDKSSCSIFSLFNKSLNLQKFKSTVETMLKIIKQNKTIPENLVNQLMSLIENFLSNISIEEQVQAIQFYINMMENFIFFLKVRNNSENEKPNIDKISMLFDNIKQPLENQEFTYEGTFLREFNQNFQDLLHFTMKNKYYKQSESLLRQFKTYSKNMEFTINEFFQLSSITDQLNYLYNILDCYNKSMKAKDADMSQEQGPLFRKKPNCKKFSIELETDLQEENEIITIPVVKLYFV